jgi:hypothetical protein
MTGQRTSALIAALGLATGTSAAGQADLAKVAKLRNPAALTEKAPDTFKAQFDTSKGSFVFINFGTTWRSTSKASPPSGR